jgi:hypothetical protein
MLTLVAIDVPLQNVLYVACITICKTFCTVKIESVDEVLDRRLEQLAAGEHTLKSALLLQGAELVLTPHRRSREIGEGMDFVMSHDAELLTRLEDA